MQPDWLSNAYVLADREGGTALFVDSGAELGPLVAAVEAWDATLVVWSPDYDGKGKAWVRFDDGTDAIVAGSRVER